MTMHRCTVCGYKSNCAPCIALRTALRELYVFADAYVGNNPPRDPISQQSPTAPWPMRAGSWGDDAPV